MTLPNPIPVLALTSDGLSVVTLSHAQPALSSPAVLGFRYFRSSVSLADAQALATADVVVGALNPSQPGLLVDGSSVTIGSILFSRVASTGTTVFNDAPGGFGQYWYAAVAWSSAGASTLTTGTVQHLAGAVPSSITATDLDVSVVFNQNLVAPTGAPGAGFSLLVGGQPVPLVGAVLQPDQVTVTLTPARRLDAMVPVMVSLDRSKTGLQSASAVKPVTISSVAATNTSLHAGLMNAVVAQQGYDQTVVTLTFSRPLTGDPLAGFSSVVNGVVTPILGGAFGVDPRIIHLTFAAAFQFSDTVVLSYDASFGSLNSGVALASFTSYPVVNASHAGTPLAEFPLSSVIRDQLTVKGGAVVAQLTLDLNSTDLLLTQQFGPAEVDFGGTYGISAALPQGYTLDPNLQTLAPGLRVSAQFLIAGQPQLAADVARDWLDRSTVAINQELGLIRGQAESTVLGTRTVRMV